MSTVEKYEAPEVITFGELDFEPAVDGQCVSLFECEVRTFYLPG